MVKGAIGLTFIVPPGQEPTGIYEDENGIEAFGTDEPYLLSDRASLQAPLPVVVVDGPVFADSMGNAQRAFAVLSIPDGSEEEPENGVVHEGNNVVHEGERVVHNG